jgi:hypothetical protein
METREERIERIEREARQDKETKLIAKQRRDAYHATVQAGVIERISH